MYRNGAKYLTSATRRYFARGGVSNLQCGQPHRTFFWRHCHSPLVVESRMRDMDRYFDRMERQFAFGPHFTPTFFGPLSNSRIFNLSTVEPEVTSENGKPGKYSITLDLGSDFPPENIKISLKDRVLTIEAKMDIKSTDSSSRLYQEISRQFTLPEGINPEEVKSLVSPDGVLSIDVPLPETDETPKSKEIPVQIND